MKYDLIEIKKLREINAKDKLTLKELKNRFAEDNSELMERMKVTTDCLDDLINTVKCEALEIYDNDKDKNTHLDFGVNIQNKTTIEYPEDVALKYVMDHNMPDLVQLNKSKFNKVASALNLDFVTIDKVPSVTIPGKIEVD